MASKMNSYGKTWHVWHTGAPGMPGDSLPLGAPHLAWSINADGELNPGLLSSRDQALGTDAADKRAQRQEFVELARPQEGVDALADKFPQRTKPPGVQAKEQAKTAQLQR